MNEREKMINEREKAVNEKEAAINEIMGKINANEMLMRSKMKMASTNANSQYETASKFKESGMSFTLFDSSTNSNDNKL